MKNFAAMGGCVLRSCIGVAAGLLLFTFDGFAGDPATDWQQVVALDAGPATKPATAQEARELSMAHLNKQEKALRSFLADHPSDPHCFEAKIRLARLLRIRGDFQNSEKARAEGRQLLDSVAKSATPEQRVEVDFARVTTLMQSMRAPTPEQRERLLAATRRFQVDHTDDRRVPALLTEVATLFDSAPKTKEALLVDALRLASDDELKGRINDDLKRLDYLGKELALQFTTLSGKSVDLAQYRGRVVLIVFFAQWSPPSIEAIVKIQKSLVSIPRDRFETLGFSLDGKPEAAADVVRQFKLAWQVGYDGKGWESPTVRSLGINTLPAVWLVDAKGKLRSINALDDTAGLVRQLLDER